jgi:hypothetical protein
VSTGDAATVAPADPRSLPLPAPFVVAVDDREKLPFAFAGLHADARQHSRPLLVETVVRHLPTGDYTIDGYTPDGGGLWAGKVGVERKSLADLYGTVGRHRARFERELERLDALDVAWVVVEAEWSTILAGPPGRCELPPKVISRSVTAWEIRYPRVHWRMMPGRAVAEATTYRLLERYWKEQQGKADQERPVRK